MPEKKLEKNILRHIAIVMDGNRRWAKKNKFKSTFKGHSHGADKLKEVAQWCIDMDIAYLSVFAFSTENWSRDEDEKKYLMDILRKFLKDSADEFNKKGIKIRIIGQRERFDEDIQRLMAEIVARTSINTKLLLQVLLSYGGKSELVHSIKQIAKSVKNGVMQIDDITEQDIEKNLWTQGVPDPDLMIRTGGEIRISNFLLWQLSYTELYFTQVLWPAFSKKDFDNAVEEYYARSRRHGK
ncbi:MAG: Isoprenyl transferase [Parcubacteria group bacterium GW2011_GWA2_38_13]|nr:MAG: Isoprenyl transferase [Parcubacteria group bacterium GW2011_GWA2_38_13]